jgi:AraC-like DNA-binding protein
MNPVADTLVADRPAPGLHGRAHARLFNDGGLFASANVLWKTKRFAASVLLAASDDELELEVDGERARFGVGVVRPFTTTLLDARQQPFVCLDLSPDHAEYHGLARITGRGCLGLPRERFAGLAATLREFHAGGMRGHDSYRLFRRITNLALTLLPASPPLDARVVQAKALLEHKPTLGADALASACGLSAQRLSQLFAQELHITPRQYTQWLKIKAALRLTNSGLTLTEIAAEAGFADSAHFCKVWTQIYGASPTYFFCNDEVNVFPKPRAALQASRLKSRNAPNSHERMPTTSV